VSARNDFDTVLAASMHSPGHPMVQNQWAAVSCANQVTDSQIDAWLLSTFGTMTVHPVLGSAPVTVHAASAQGCLDAGGTTIVKTEFFVHRGGDSHGHHYVAQLAAAPLRLVWFQWVGVVPESEFALLPGHLSAVNRQRVSLRAVNDTLLTDGLGPQGGYTFRGSNRSAGGFSFRGGASSGSSGWGFRQR
jgi:hypothetical protein